MAVLIPIPDQRALTPPSFTLQRTSDPEELWGQIEATQRTMEAWAKDVAERYNALYNVVRSNMERLGRPTGASADPSPQNSSFVGFGLASDSLRSVPVNLASSRVMHGLQLANGSDNGKVNVSFRYLGIGPVIVGSGATVTYTADLAVSGANGLDTGAEAANTWYAVYVIVGDDAPNVVDQTANNNQPTLWRRGARVATLLSTSATAPTLPPGYNRFRRVGWVRNDASSNIKLFVNAEDSPWFFWNTALTSGDALVLNAGTATSYTDVSCAAVAPPTCRQVGLIATCTRSSAGFCTLAVRNNGSNNIENSESCAIISVGSDTKAVARFFLDCDSSQVIEYSNVQSSQANYLAVFCYADER